MDNNNQVDKTLALCEYHFSTKFNYQFTPGLQMTLPGHREFFPLLYAEKKGLVYGGLFLKWHREMKSQEIDEYHGIKIDPHTGEHLTQNSTKRVIVPTGYEVRLVNYVVININTKQLLNFDALDSPSMLSLPDHATSFIPTDIEMIIVNLLSERCDLKELGRCLHRRYKDRGLVQPRVCRRIDGDVCIYKSRDGSTILLPVSEVLSKAINPKGRFY